MTDEQAERLIDAIENIAESLKETNKRLLEIEGIFKRR